MRPPDSFNAFCSQSTAVLKGASAGALAGLSFAAKDLFDIVGHVTGAGNPDWLASHPPAAQTAPVVQKLVDAGATMVGKTHTDELSRGLFGVGFAHHRGTGVDEFLHHRCGLSRRGMRREPVRVSGAGHMPNNVEQIFGRKRQSRERPCRGALENRGTL